MRQVSTQSRYLLSDSVVPKYNTACHRNIIDLLQHGKKADCQAADPTGLDALTLAKDVRRTLKTLARRGTITPALRRELEDLNQRLDLDDDPHVVGSGIGLALA
jgi:hypothetical protein